MCCSRRRCTNSFARVGLRPARRSCCIGSRQEALTALLQNLLRAGISASKLSTPLAENSGLDHIATNHGSASCKSIMSPAPSVGSSASTECARARWLKIINDERCDGLSAPGKSRNGTSALSLTSAKSALKGTGITWGTTPPGLTTPYCCAAPLPSTSRA